MSEIVSEIKDELGPDAVILHTRRKIKGGVWGFFGKEVIEVLAGLEINVELNESSGEGGSANGSSYADEANAIAAQAAAAIEQKTESSEGMGLDVTIDEDIDITEEPEPAEEADDEAPAPPKVIEQITPVEIDPVEVAAPSNGDVGELRSELSELRDTVAKLAASVKDGISAEELEDLPLTYLLAQGVSHQHAKELVDKAGLSGPDKFNTEQIIEKVSDYLSGEIKVTGQIRVPTKAKTKTKAKTGPKKVAFVGPTGVGKTTTIAKLAARFALGKHKDIALITADFFRIGAVRQLKTYAAITGVPLDVIHTAEELEEAIENHKDKELILIDTAGHSQNNESAMEELEKLFSETPFGKAEVDEFHLVVSATSKYEDLKRIASVFDNLPLTAYLFTKLDESSTYGPLISLLLDNKKPVSYLTNGQRVPEDIMTARAEHLCKTLIKGNPEE